MNLRLKILASLGVLVIMSLWLTGVLPVAQAQGDTTLTGRSVFDVNIRSTPGINSAVIGVLPGHEEATAVGRTSGNNWIQIRYQSTTGWVAAWVMVFSGDTALLPVTTEIQPPPASSGGPFVMLSPYNVNVRADPWVSSPILTVIPFNTEASATGRNNASSWVRVRYHDVEGWAAAWLVILNGDINALPVAGEAAPPPGEKPAATATPTPKASASTPPPPQTPQTPQKGLTVLAPFRINVRSAPNLDGAVLDVLPLGASASAVGRNAGNNWVQVEYNGTRGWVAAWVVVASDDTLLLPVTSDSTQVTEAEVDLTGAGIHELIIRAGPGLNFAPLGTLPANTSAPLMARTEGSNWVRLSYGGVEGWVAAWLLVASADLNNLPVEAVPTAP
jgi:uncharacterized protein YraI